MHLYAKPWLAVFADASGNTVDEAFVPEVWAEESLMILEANMLAANLVHRDFSNEIAQFGDTVNTRIPSEFTAERKTDGDDVTVQNAVATNIPVVLNQHIHTSFRIRDGEESKGFKSLREEFLYPAVLSIAQALDEIVLGQVYEFLANATIAGKLGTDPTVTTIVDLRQAMNEKKVPDAPGLRKLILTPDSEAALLAIDTFHEADKVGDEGTALRNGSLGQKFGFDIYMCQNCPQIATGSTVVTGAINNADGEAAGQTALTVDGFSAAITAGSWITVAGDMTPQMVVSTVGGSVPTTITVTPGLKYDTVNNAVVTVYTPGAINLGDGYAAGWSKKIVYDGFTVAPKVGQMLSTGATAAALKKYSALKTPTTTTGYLNRALDSAVSNDDVLGLGPKGSYNFAFVRNAVALVTRPLANPAPGTGALSYTSSANGVGIRVTITYNGEKQGHLVTVDVLAGVKTLDTNRGAVMLG